MSMLGIAFLNEIVKKDHTTNLNEILNKLRKNIIESLGQEEESSMKDGMDMSIISIDTKENKIYFAGSNNPLFVVKRNMENKEFHAEIIKADPIPVSMHDNLSPFSQKELELQGVVALYLTTDGYYDQFGGEKGRKFNKKRFRALLANIASKPIEEQNKSIEQEFINWKGDFEQTDDVLVMGIQL